MSKGGDNMSKTDSVSHIVNSIRGIVSSLDRYSKNLTRTLGLTGPQLGVLRTIDQNSKITVGGLSERLYLHISTVSGIVDRLEAGGYLVRRRSETDRRVVWPVLTDKGKRAIVKAPPSGFGYMLNELEKLPVRQLRSIQASLQTLSHLMLIDESWEEKLFTEGGKSSRKSRNLKTTGGRSKRSERRGNVE
jgi:DNA-binding MarR family transcriptional regulator